jgi:hypothetical protein
MVPTKARHLDGGLFCGPFNHRRLQLVLREVIVFGRNSRSSLERSFGFANKPRRFLFPPLPIPPRLGSFAGYLGPLTLREVFGVALTSLSPELTELQPLGSSLRSYSNLDLSGQA